MSSLISVPLAVLTFAGALPVHNQTQVCGTREDLLKSLGQLYSEVPTGAGLDSQHHAVELLVGDSGSWTLLVTLPGGETCVIDYGEGWEVLPAGRPS